MTTLFPLILVSQSKFTSAPTVLVSAEHERRGVKRDASSLWVEDVTTTSFKVCVRELQNFDGAHQNIHIVSFFEYSSNHINPINYASFLLGITCVWKDRLMTQHKISTTPTATHNPQPTTLKYPLNVLKRTQYQLPPLTGSFVKYPVTSLCSST